MKFMIIAKKELGDMVQEKLYLLAFFVQLVIVMGIIYTALLYTSITNPEVAKEVVPQVNIRVGVVGDLDIEGVEVIRFKPSKAEEPFKTMRDNNLVALVVRNKESFTIYLDNTNVLSSYADLRITDAIEKLSREIKRREIAKKVDPEVILNPVELEIKGKAGALPSTFLEIMYALLIPFILLLPTFLATNMVADSIIGEREKRTYELLVSAPVKKRDIIVGKALPVIAIAELQALLWMLLLRVRGIVVYNLPYVLLLLLLLNVIFVGFGILISAFSQDMKDSNVFISATLILASIYFFAPISTDFYSLSPVSLLCKLSSNPVILDKKIFLAYPLLFFAGVLILVISIKALEYRENLRL